MHVAPSAWSLALVCLLGVAGCSSDRERPASSEPRAAGEAVPAPPPAEPSPAAPSAVVPASSAASPGVEPSGAPPAVPAPREIEGLRITPGADGTIRIEGSDRWGGDATTTYESVDFLEPALPVLARSLTPAQVEGLTALVAELRAR